MSDAYERDRELNAMGVNADDDYWPEEWIEDEALDAAHALVGSRFVESSNYEGWLHQCLCGERFMEESELQQHVFDTNKAAKQQVERAIFRNGGLRSFPTLRRGV